MWHSTVMKLLLMQDLKDVLSAAVKATALLQTQFSGLKMRVSWKKQTTKQRAISAQIKSQEVPCKRKDETRKNLTGEAAST